MLDSIIQLTLFCFKTLLDYKTVQNFRPVSNFSRQISETDEHFINGLQKLI